jgi:oxygen-dependent protoporphyrinogen oxidase
MKQVAVIGAGMAGAGAAWKLQRAGHRVTVYEKEAWTGGRTRTYRGKGYHLNTGAGFFTNFYPRLRALIRELGLEQEVIENPKVVTLATPDRKYDYKLDSVYSFMRIPWLSVRDKARLLRHTAALTLSKKQLDLADPSTLASRDDASIQEYTLRKLGQRNYDYLVRTAIEPYWYFSCADASRAMLDGLQAHAAGARFFTLRDGMDSLVPHLLKHVTVHMQSPVQALRPHTEAGEAMVRMHREGHDPADYDAVVVATTSHTAAGILDDWPDMHGLSRQFMASQRYAANINAYFYVPSDLLQDFSPQTSPCGGFDDELAAIAVHGARVNTNELPGQALLGVWLTDAASRNRLEMPDQALADLLWQMVRRYHPQFPAHTPGLAHVTRRMEAIPVHAPGRYRDAARILKEQTGPVLLAGDYLTTATMEGALNSGFLAADKLIEQWK